MSGVAEGEAQHECADIGRPCGDLAFERRAIVREEGERGAFVTGKSLPEDLHVSFKVGRMRERAEDWRSRLEARSI